MWILKKCRMSACTLSESHDASLSRTKMLERRHIAVRKAMPSVVCQDCETDTCPNMDMVSLQTLAGRMKTGPKSPTPPPTAPLLEQRATQPETTCANPWAADEPLHRTLNPKPKTPKP